MTLDHSVELERLPRGDFESPIPMLVRNLIYQEPLPWAADASRHPNADHERISGFYALGLTVVSNISVVLLVDTVEFGELGVGWGECTGGVVHEALGDCSSKVLGSGFDVFVGDRLGFGLRNLDVVDAQCLPQLRFPELIPGLGTIGVLVVSESKFHETLCSKAL